MKSPNINPILTLGNWYHHYLSIPQQSVDLVLTDPPYGILEKHRDWDKPIDLKEFEITLSYVLKDTGLVIVLCNLQLLTLLLSSFTMFTQRSYHVWRKPSGMCISDVMPLPDCEFILVFKRKDVRTKDTTWHPKEMLPAKQPYTKKSNILESPTRRHIKSPLSTNVDGKRWVTTTLSAPHKPCMPKLERSSHPSQKPEQLLRSLIRGYSNPSDIIIDPFSGSGSTLISAKKEGRFSQGYELNETYYTEAQSRIDKATSQQSLFSVPVFNEKSQKTVDTE